MSSKGLNEGALCWLMDCIKNLDGVGEKLILVVSDINLDESFMSGTVTCKSSANRYEAEQNNKEMIKTIFFITKCVVNAKRKFPNGSNRIWDFFSLYLYIGAKLDKKFEIFMRVSKFFCC